MKAHHATMGTAGPDVAAHLIEMCQLVGEALMVLVINLMGL